jgi:hypothetical protein
VYITLCEHALFEILTLTEINERLDKRETGDNLFAKRVELDTRASLKRNRLSYR